MLLVGAAWPLAHLAAQRGEGAVRYRLAYATLLGGSAWDQAREVIVEPQGSLLIGAQSSSSDMPTTPGVVQPQYAGDDPALGPGGVYSGDCYLARLSADGRKLLAATYFGGSKQERNVYGMALDREGNVVITTMTRSSDVPTTAGCLQPRYGGGPSDMLVAKLSADLRKVLWCTYLGGSGDESPRGGLTLDEQGAVYVVGTSDSADFPTTRGVVQEHRNGPRDSVIAKLAPDGSALEFSTLLGGSGEDDAIMGVRLDAAGRIYVAGHTKSADFPVTAGAAQPKPGGQSDCYLAALSPDASKILYASYLGGTGNEFAEHRPYLTADGCLLLSGFAGSDDFPTTAGAYQRRRNGEGDGFVTKLAADGKAFVFSTLLGGSGNDSLLMPTPLGSTMGEAGGTGEATRPTAGSSEAEGNLIVVGSSASRDFPVAADALQPTFGGGNEDAVLAVLSPDGSRLLYATFLGGTGEEMIRSVALGPGGELYLVGNTSSDDFPVTADALQATHAGGGDTFVAKLVPEG